MLCMIQPYANPIKGNPKFMREYYDINFFYPWITVVGTFASSFSQNGYTNTGTASIFPYVPVIGNNPAFVVVSSALSGETHNIASRLGWKTWGGILQVAMVIDLRLFQTLWVFPYTLIFLTFRKKISKKKVNGISTKLHNIVIVEYATILILVSIGCLIAIIGALNYFSIVNLSITEY